VVAVELDDLVDGLAVSEEEVFAGEAEEEEETIT
jgi:hypothetical protein